LRSLTLAETKIFAGDRLRRLREQAGLKQAELAQDLGLSASYLNQIERDQRPLTPRLLARLAEMLNVPPTYFAGTEDARRESQLREDLGDPLFRAIPGADSQLHALIRAAPAFADAFMVLYRAYTAQSEERQLLLNAPAPRFPYDEVRDWVQSRQNHFGALDHEAEAMFAERNFSSATLRDDLRRYLRDVHGIATGSSEGLLAQGVFWRLNRSAKFLHLTAGASPESEIFWLAHVIAQLAQRPLIERELRRANFSSEDARGLARIALANYFAGALLMPYGRFHAAAVASRYDIQRLQRGFGASFEQVAHRLSTLQRPDLPGIPRAIFSSAAAPPNSNSRSSAVPVRSGMSTVPSPIPAKSWSSSPPRRMTRPISTSPARSGAAAAPISAARAPWPWCWAARPATPRKPSTPPGWIWRIRTARTRSAPAAAPASAPPAATAPSPPWAARWTWGPPSAGSCPTGWSVR
jgi:transcriptional regulator with XRE-family HTH domain